jgi:hypothetical protein
MAVLDHDHTHLLQSKPGEAFCVVQFVLFWVGFFGLAYLAGLLFGLG